MQTLRNASNSLAGLSLVRLEETQQAQQNLDVQVRSRFGPSKTFQVVSLFDKSEICQIQFTIILARPFFNILLLWHHTVLSSILVRVYLVSLRRT